MGAGDAGDGAGRRARRGRKGASWWARSDIKRICEYLFGVGALTTGARRALPAALRPTGAGAAARGRSRAHPADPEVSARTLVLQAAGALGVATEPDLRDYYRLGPAQSQQAVAELVDDGALEPVVVRGWRNPAYRLPGPDTAPGRRRGRCCRRSTR